MIRIAFVAALAAVPFLFSAAPVVAPPPCPNTIEHEPLVLYDISGSTLAGSFDMALTVYNDGTARLSSIGQLGKPSKVELAFPGPAANTQLLLDLSALGAGTLCDNFVAVADAPTATLTVFRNATDPRNHTFSWKLSLGAYAQVEQRLTAYIQATFPGF
jgi:hypothetical protein